jgi:hypothetical protein
VITGTLMSVALKMPIKNKLFKVFFCFLLFVGTVGILLQAACKDKQVIKRKIQTVEIKGFHNFLLLGDGSTHPIQISRNKRGSKT